MTALATPPTTRDDLSPSTPDEPRVRIRPVPAIDPPFDDDPPGRTPAAAFERLPRGPRPQRPVTPRPPRGPAVSGGPPGPPWAGPVPAGPALATVLDDHRCVARTGDDGGAADPPDHADQDSGDGPPGAGGDGTAAAGTTARGTAAGRAAVAAAGRAAAAESATGGSEPARSRIQTPAQIAAQRFAKVCVEVLNGHRPATHLRAITCPAEVNGITDQLMRRTGRVYLARQGMTAPGPHRVQLRQLLVGEPHDGVAELTLVFEYGSRSWAMAARLERRFDTWLCTLVQVI
jgi:hypothetical protein